jgi:hypothetical protein
MEVLEPREYLSLTVPALSSLPGADHTIYLDFDGHVTEGTDWNHYWSNPSIQSPAFDIGGDVTSLSDTEVARIENVWKRVSEDFIPFEVNVTTVDPGVEALRKSDSSDTAWGVRVVITEDTENCGLAGMSYSGSFNLPSDTPVFVYVTSEVAVAEVVSHEVGHSLNLAHDGTSATAYYTGHGSGETGWAPIMGAGYSTNVTTWDRGEYFGSDNAGTDANYGQGSDDLSIITGYNGFGYRPDDHGDTSASASPLTVADLSVGGSGIIETTSDVDVLSFTTGAGNVTLNVIPFRPGPNLDVQAELYGADGELVALSDPDSTLDAGMTVELAAGQYYLHVTGTGTGDPTADPPTGYSDYASLGRYTVQGTIVDPGEMPPDGVDPPIDPGPDGDPVPPPPNYDIDGSGRIDLGDLSYFATAFGKDADDPTQMFARVSDFDGSGHVDFGDLALLAANFMKCPGDGDTLIFPSHFSQTGGSQTPTCDDTIPPEAAAIEPAGAHLADGLATSRSNLADLESRFLPQTVRVKRAVTDSRGARRGQRVSGSQITVGATSDACTDGRRKMRITRQPRALSARLLSDTSALPPEEVELDPEGLAGRLAADILETVLASGGIL